MTLDGRLLADVGWL